MAQHILVVDDDHHTPLLFTDLLEASGYAVTSAANGREALAYLGREQPPAAILLDLGMPGMNGWEFRDELRKNPALALIPVFLLSGEHELHRIAASLGVAGFFPKPVEVDGLLDTLRSLGSAPDPPEN